jgi:hypothetical protein
LAHPVALKQGMRDLAKWGYKKCIDHLADVQAGDIVPTQTNDYPQTVPADDACPSKTTQVRVAQYKNAGGLALDSYGDGGTKQRGFLVARIANLGDCATRDPVAIPPHTTVYWVVDREHKDQKIRSHFIVAGTGEYLGGHASWNFVRCDHNPASGDNAMMKFGNPCDDYAQSPSVQRSGGGPGGGPGGGSQSARPRLFAYFDTVWLNCGGNCCYADAIMDY